ncbi:MAG TPA: polysaccharide deacetylase family protein [Verrucomicrobiae bacterium]|nr:polysaccharide deacetylase family protein [Verrucomicrobiae bacterium]
MTEHLCILYDDRCPASVVAARYCRWFYDLVFDLKSRLVNSAEEQVPSLSSFDAIFLLSALDGRDRFPGAGQEALRAVAGSVPVFSAVLERDLVLPPVKYPFGGGRVPRTMPRLAALVSQFRTSPQHSPRSIWPVCLRIDDPPASWWLLKHKKQILQADDYRRILDILEQFDAKLTVMCVPAIPYGKHFVPWWEWTRQFDGIFEQLHRGVSSGRIEIGCHGLTHLTIGRAAPSRLREWLGRRRNRQHNPTREFYDDLRRRSISDEAQLEHIQISMALLSKFFGCRIRSFTPGAHNWDDGTEKSAALAGLEFFAADCGFEQFAPGGDLCKNPSPLGERAPTDQRLLYVSRLVAWPTEAADVECLHALGIPFTISAHNYGGTMLRPSQLESFLTSLQQFGDRKHFTVSELGDLLAERACGAADRGATVNPGYQ